ncbi:MULTISPECIES: hypothetical protein [Rothia]|uniref:hypothetical protein n=1 Tax=Rothia TaxID=32207 RepID=UPI0008A3CB48|nr:hypothetical protein [Rothia sp. HMSC078H08]OFN70594.1 hypothetical protein HMPREF2528_02090 [Rothia sp. HMSC078H08]
MKKNSPRKKNVSKKRNNSKKNGYSKKKSIIAKKPTKKVAFKNFLHSKAIDIWRDREKILLMLCVLAFPASLYFISYVNPYNDSTICTVTSVEIVEHEDPYSISGEFETEECGIITSSKSPDGIPIRKYLQNFETGKKYRAYKSFDTRNDEFDFSVLRFEEIKE